jgi:hypothetical protein
MKVYCIKNRITGKKYVGATTMSVSQRVSVHKYVAIKLLKGHELGASIRAWGWDAFEWEVLQECHSRVEMDKAEVEWMHKLGTFAPFGYNLRVGGSRGSHSALTVERMRKRVFTPEWRARLSASMKGKKLSPENRVKAIARLRAAKRISLPGERNGRAKLNREEVEEIREIYKNGGISQEDIAAAYGVNQTSVSFIVRGVHWL